MNVGSPHTALASAVDVEALVALSGAASPLTGREVARRAGRSHDRVRKVLDRLVEHGLVSRIEAGRARLYLLNREHLVAPAIEQLAGLRIALVDRLREELRAWDVQPVAAALFGSAARGDGDTQSDIDLLVVRPATADGEDPPWRAQIDRLSERVYAWTGNHARTIELGEDELPELSARQPPILRELREDAIPLIGPRPASLVGAGA